MATLNSTDTNSTSWRPAPPASLDTDFWGAGQIWAVAWMAFSVPFVIGVTSQFWKKRTSPLIAGRQPELVLITNIIFALFTICLCTQRLFAPTYPCWLTMWQGFVGTIALADVMLVRCWLLYSSFTKAQFVVQNQRNITAQRSAHGSTITPQSSDQPVATPGKTPWYMERKWMSKRYLFKLLLLKSVFMVIPCVVFTAVSADIRDWKGDGCVARDIPDGIVAGYTVAYLVLFIMFSIKLRVIVDGYHLKEELKYMGIMGLISIVFWFAFNVFDGLNDINDYYFPVSTLAVVLGIMIAFSISTFYPLRLAATRSCLPDVPTPDMISTFQGLLNTEQGFAAFQEFLVREFAPENLMFWKRVQEFKELGNEMLNHPQRSNHKHYLSIAQRIYDEFVKLDSSTPVNLKADVVKDITAKLKEYWEKEGDGRESVRGSIAGIGDVEMSPTSETPNRRSMLANKLLHRSHSPNADDSHGYEALDSAVDESTRRHQHLLASSTSLFDAAEAEIWDLMKRDKYSRYVRSDLHKQLVEDINGEQLKLTAFESVIGGG